MEPPGQEEKSSALDSTQDAGVRVPSPYNDDAKRAEFKLLSDSIRQWERYQQFNKGVSSGAANEAKRRIAKLKDLKKDLEY